MTGVFIVFHRFFIVVHGSPLFFICFSWFFVKLDFKELDFKELDIHQCFNDEFRNVLVVNQSVILVDFLRYEYGKSVRSYLLS